MFPQAHCGGTGGVSEQAKARTRPLRIAASLRFAAITLRGYSRNHCHLGLLLLLPLLPWFVVPLALPSGGQGGINLQSTQTVSNRSRRARDIFPFCHFLIKLPYGSR
jgi:hypothetical protein